MSSAYKDWEIDKIQEENEIVEKYPFLKITNGQSKFPMIDLELPDGWIKLFYQMCDDLKEQLIKENLLDSFRIIQAKEKYNYLRVYTNTDCSNEVLVILRKYENMSHFICSQCGKPADVETQGYFLSFCEACYKYNSNGGDSKRLQVKYEFPNWNGSEGLLWVSFQDEYDRYIKSLGE